MPVFALLVISKAGSLIYHRTFPANTASTSQPSTGTLGLPGTTSLTTNDYLVLAGTFHGVHAITRSLTPKLPYMPPVSSTPRDSVSYSPMVQTPLPSASLQHGSNTTSVSASNLSNTQPSYSYPDPTGPATGIESLESSFFRLTVFQTLTGTKFLLFTDPSMPNTEVIMKGVYERFSDYVCKNPFWQMEMPIRIESWEREITKWLTRR